MVVLLIYDYRKSAFDLFDPNLLIAKIDYQSLGSKWPAIRSCEVCQSSLCTIRKGLRWNDLPENITIKTPQRLYLLKQLKRTSVNHCSLIQFCCACVRSVLEYACQMFPTSLPVYLNFRSSRKNPEKITTIIFDRLKRRLLATAGAIIAVFDRHEKLCLELFN